MDHVLDIYLRLVIQTLTFVAPLMTLFVSLYSRIYSDRTKKAEERKRQIEEAHITQIQRASVSVADVTLQTAADIKVHQVQSSRELRLLNPTRQLARMFLPLLASLTLGAATYPLGFDATTLTLTPGSAFSCVLSLICYVLALCVIRQVLWNLVRMTGEEVNRPQ
jgi:hypothetical protein